MTTTTHRNIHAIPPRPDDEDFGQEARGQNAPLGLPRLRAITNDPQREYAQRDGQVEPLPDHVAALILCRKGWAKVERQQIKVTLDGKDLLFASRESITIAEHNGTGRRVLWVLNRRAPDVLHILTDDARYVETIPRKGEAQWFDHSEASQAARGDAQAMLQRDVARLRSLHRPDEAAEAERTAHNAAQVRRLVQTFPADVGRVSRRATDHCVEASLRRDACDFPRAETIVAAMRNADCQRERHAERVVSDASLQRIADAALSSSTPCAADSDRAALEDLADAALRSAGSLSVQP